ncbi:hypothetical protein [Sporomusa aerivorans]|uniref:hypothetical protein n=1 Tax=Sporomusa aerivorans TaxID=204936 RepID=UPI003529FB29
MIDLKKLFRMVAVMMVVGAFSLFLCLVYIVESSYVSEEEYARMAQEIVEQSINQPIENKCLK